ncbi:unnamed protein product [Closterium sp. Yama58-4]|nr:unnamed protein product [Closterium sp. Yama58-4]
MVASGTNQAVKSSSSHDSQSSLECCDGGVTVTLNRSLGPESVPPPPTDAATTEPPRAATVTVIEPQVLLLSLSVLQSRVSHLQALLGMLAQPSSALKIEEAPYEQAAVAVGTMIRQLAVAAVSLLPPNQQAAVLQSEPLLQPAPGAQPASSNPPAPADGNPSHPNEGTSNLAPSVLAPAATHTAAAPEAATLISPKLKSSSTIAEPGELRHRPAGEAIDATLGRGPSLEAQSLTVRQVVGIKRGRDHMCGAEPAAKAICHAEPHQRSSLCGRVLPPGLGVAVAAQEPDSLGATVTETGGDMEAGSDKETEPTGANPCGLPSAGVVSEVFSCPASGCPFNKQHPGFRAFKSKASLRNHYRRTHAGEALLCSRCGSKSFCLPADLEAHERRCGLRRWLCSCGNSFSRKDKLANHLKVFPSHHELATQSTPLPDPSYVQHTSPAPVEQSGPFNASDQLPDDPRNSVDVNAQGCYDVTTGAHQNPAIASSVLEPCAGLLYKDAVSAVEALAESFAQKSKEHVMLETRGDVGFMHLLVENQGAQAVESTFSVTELFPELSC